MAEWNRTWTDDAHAQWWTHDGKVQVCGGQDTIDLTVDDCIQWDDAILVSGSLPAGEYLIIVDGIDGAVGPFTLDTACSVELTCTTIEGTADFATGNRQSLSVAGLPSKVTVLVPGLPSKVTVFVPRLLF